MFHILPAKQSGEMRSGALPGYRLININTCFRVRNTHDEFQSSAKWYHKDNHMLKTTYNVECSWSMKSAPNIYKCHHMNKWTSYAIPLKLTAAFLKILCVIQLHSAYLLWPECWQLQTTWAVKLTLIILCQPRFRCLCSTFCLSVSYSFSMSSHLAVSVSHLPFIAISQTRFSALQACSVPLPTF